MSTATAEPVTQAPKQDALPPLHESFGAALKAQEATPEPAAAPEKEPAAKQPDPVKEAPKEPAKPAAKEPAKDAPKGKRSAIDAALSDDAPVEVKKEPEVDEVAQLLETKDPNWTKARETLKRQSEELKTFREKKPEIPPDVAEQLKAAKELKAERDRLAEENAKYRDAIVEVDVRYEPEFRAKHVVGRGKSVDSLAQRIKEYGGDAEAFVSAMEMPLEKRNKALDAALAGIESPRELTTINTKLAQIELLDEERDALLSNVHQTAEQRARQREMQAQEADARAQELKDATFEKFSREMPKLSKLMRQVPDDAEGAKEFNEALQKDFQEARRLIDPITHEEAMTAAFKAARYDSVEKEFLKYRETAGARISELESALAKMEGADPGFRGGGKPPAKADHEVPLLEAFNKALTGQAPV